MKALIVKPGLSPFVSDLPDLEAMQACVGGYLEAVHPWPDKQAVLVCDEEGLFHDEDWNRYVCEGLVIKGTFFICGVGDDDFTDLSDELIEFFSLEFHEPHLFLRNGKHMCVLRGNEILALC